MQYKRTEIADGIGFSSVIDEKFKTCSLTVRFITKLDKATAAANSLAISQLSAVNSRYGTIAAMNEKLSSLYGASLSSSVSKRGDVQLLAVGASWITDKYTIGGENISREMLEILRDCIFSPRIENGEFDAETFAITKKDLLDRIEAEINNKRGYAIAKASEIAYKGEPAANSCYGTAETASPVTSAQAFEAYRKLLETACAEIYFVAPEDDKSVAEMFAESFGALDRKPQPVTYRTPSPAKSEPETASEEYNVRQAKMVMTFKTSSEDKEALKMMSLIFGETPVSKLFMNVREKLSLCYYCACRTYFPKGALMVDSGVERDNIDKAREEILRQLDDMKNGSFTDSDIEAAVLAVTNGLTAIGDTPSSYAGWYFECFCNDELITPQQQAERYRAVTRDRIIEAAKSLSLDSIYLMLNKEAE